MQLATCYARTENFAFTPPNRKPRWVGEEGMRMVEGFLDEQFGHVGVGLVCGELGGFVRAG